MKRSFEQDLIEHCAPTLAGLKPASLFHIRTEDAHALHQKVADWNDVLQARGLTLCIIKAWQKNNSFLIYLYRETQLAQLLQDAQTQAFLQQEGYTVGGDCAAYLQQLSGRLYQDEFPHEIGVFLGYPLQDVIGFIQHKGKNFTHCGNWKVYGDAEPARAQFAKFRHCTQTYLRCFHSGISIHRLAVAV